MGDLGYIWKVELQNLVMDLVWKNNYSGLEIEKGRVEGEKMTQHYTGTI